MHHGDVPRSEPLGLWPCSMSLDVLSPSKEVCSSGVAGVRMPDLVPPAMESLNIRLSDEAADGRADIVKKWVLSAP